VSKTFSASRKAQKKEPIVFFVGEEQFDVPRPLPGFAMLDLAALEDAEGSAAVRAFHGFFEQVMPKDLERLRLACNAEGLPLSPEADDVDEDGEDGPSVLGIVQYIIEEGVGRPTQQRSASPESQSTDSTSSLTAVG
jgi:hypothetical protein